MFFNDRALTSYSFSALGLPRFEYTLRKRSVARASLVCDLKSSIGISRSQVISKSTQEKSITWNLLQMSMSIHK
jgi:hypothetical protein